MLFVILCMLSLGVVSACSPSAAPQDVGIPTEVEAPELTATVAENDAPEFVLMSSAFEDGAEIPLIFTCDGEDVSPPLAWENAPQDTATFALILEDPDAPGGTWIHWVLFEIPIAASGLDGGIESGSNYPAGTTLGENDWGEIGYGGPCPPSGTHRYFFYLFALDKGAEIQPGATAETLRSAIEGQILAQSSLMGTYSR